MVNQPKMSGPLFLFELSHDGVACWPVPVNVSSRECRDSCDYLNDSPGNIYDKIFIVFGLMCGCKKCLMCGCEKGPPTPLLYDPYLGGAWYCGAKAIREERYL